MPVPTPDWFAEDNVADSEFDDTPSSLSVEELARVLGHWAAPLPSAE